jgi:hypothetical protein
LIRAAAARRGRGSDHFVFSGHLQVLGSRGEPSGQTSVVHAPCGFVALCALSTPVQTHFSASSVPVGQTRAQGPFAKAEIGISNNAKPRAMATIFIFKLLDKINSAINS